MPILKSPLYKIIGIKKNDCAFVRHFNAEIGDIVKFDYDPSEYRPKVHMNFINKNERKEIRSVHIRSFDSFIETETITEDKPNETKPLLNNFDL